jgi:hypothetical protein
MTELEPYYSRCLHPSGRAPLPILLQRQTCYPSLMTVEDIEEAILKLSPDELARLRRWFAEFESGMAAPKPPERMAEKLGRVAGRTLAEWRKLSREP